MGFRVGPVVARRNVPRHLGTTIRSSSDYRGGPIEDLAPYARGYVTRCAVRCLTGPWGYDGALTSDLADRRLLSSVRLPAHPGALGQPPGIVRSRFNRSPGRSALPHFL